MWNWLQIWAKGYQASFNSPYPIEKCGQILRDHASSDYFEHPNRKLVGIDIYPLSENTFSFTMQKNILLKHYRGKGTEINRIAGLKVEIKGTVERNETGTQITYASQSNTLWWAISSLPLFIFMTIGLSLLFTPIESPTIIRLIGLLCAIISAGIFVYAPILYRVYRFSQFPYNLLSDIPQIAPEAIAPKRWYRFQKDFNFFAQYPLSTCIQKLAYPDSKNESYQLTPIGVLYGNTGLDRLFVGLKEISPEKTYFWIQSDSPYHDSITATAFGMLQAEGDNYTRIVGFSEKPSIKFYWLGLVVLAIFLIILNPSLLFFIPLIYLLIKMVLTVEADELAQYLAKTILGKQNAQQNTKWGWLLLKHKFDFHSPYPVDDAVNMFLNYTPLPTEYTTPWGIGKRITQDNMDIIVYEQDINTYQFIVQVNRAKNPVIYTDITVMGMFQTEGYGVRVYGKVNHKMPPELWIITIIMFSVALILFWGLPSTRVTITILMMLSLGRVYLQIIHQIRKSSSYPHRVLGEKSSRKRKLADTADFE